MGNFALITGNIVNLVEDIPASSIEEVYEKYRAQNLIYIDVTNHEPEVTPGWRYINDELLPPYEPTIEDKLIAIRISRNFLLTSCDWTQLPDVTLTQEKVTEWRVYRQALRDFPETCDPDNPIWPTQPV
jgi:hypothetical protein